MKRNIWKAIVCMVLVVLLGAAPLASASASSLAYIMKVNVSDARLREKPGNSDVVVKLKKGTKVLYWGVRSGSFYKVSTTSGDTGYIYADFLSNYGTVKKSMVGFTESDAPVYRRSGSSMRRCGTLAEDSLVLVYKTNNGWAYIKTVSGKSGYMKLSDLQKAF